MGGRGASGGSSSGRLALAAIEREIKERDYIKNSFQDGEKLLTSAYFVDHVKSDIGKEAFNRGYEITTKQVDSMSEKIISGIKPRGQRDADALDKARKEAKEYFAKTYNPNKEQREITSSTYKRAQGGLKRDADNWFGRGMSGKKGK